MNVKGTLALAFGCDWERIKEICKELKEFWLNPMKGRYKPKSNLKTLKKMATENSTSVVEAYNNWLTGYLKENPEEAMRYYMTKQQRPRTIKGLEEELKLLVNGHGAMVTWDAHNVAASCGDRFTFTIKGEEITYTF